MTSRRVAKGPSAWSTTSVERSTISNCATAPSSASNGSTVTILSLGRRSLSLHGGMCEAPFDVCLDHRLDHCRVLIDGASRALLQASVLSEQLACDLLGDLGLPRTQLAIDPDVLKGGNRRHRVVPFRVGEATVRVRVMRTRPAPPGSRGEAEPRSITLALEYLDRSACWIHLRPILYPIRDFERESERHVHDKRAGNGDDERLSRWADGADLHPSLFRRAVGPRSPDDEGNVDAFAAACVDKSMADQFPLRVRDEREVAFRLRILKV